VRDLFREDGVEKAVVRPLLLLGTLDEVSQTRRALARWSRFKSTSSPSLMTHLAASPTRGRRGRAEPRAPLVASTASRSTGLVGSISLLV
jgi:hypothetical protein